MNSITPMYYAPYNDDNDALTDDVIDASSDGLSDDGLSDELSDRLSDEQSDSDDTIMQRKEEDPRYALIRAAGPNFNTSAEQLKYMENELGYVYDSTTDITSLSTLIYLNPPKTTQTSLFSVKSLNRDATVFTSPFNFEIKTPRIYKNVTKIQLVQVSFPNNTQTFVASPVYEAELISQLLTSGISLDCISTCLTITDCQTMTTSFGAMERGRVSDGLPFMVKFSIPNGVYTNETLAQALNSNSNNTPPLNLISYQDFKNEIQSHGDFSILFNEPGEKYYSNTTKTQYTFHSKHDIMKSYYSPQYTDSITDINDKVAFNAYYYPIMKELFATNRAKLYFDCTPYSYEQVFDMTLGKFLGLDSDIYYNLCSNNQSRLDAFRKNLTFENNPINKYVWSYDSNLRRFSVTHNSLHPSLQNDITRKYNSYLQNEINVRGLTTKSFQTLKTSYMTNKSIFKSLESNLSTVLSEYGYGGDYLYLGGQYHNTNTATDLQNDTNFTSIFNYSAIFGKQFHSNFHGQLLTFSNFLDYHSTISSYYNSVLNTSSIISSVFGSVSDSHHTYVSTKYGSVLPYHVINNKSYNNSQGVPVIFIGNQFSYSAGQPITDDYLKAMTLLDVQDGFTFSDPNPCVMECCNTIELMVKRYYGCLPVTTLVGNYPTSLAYRLGIPTFDFSNFVSISSTFFNTTSTQNFNILLQLNAEMSMNNLDVAMNENYSVTNETTGQVKLMAAKLLMQGVGSGETSETAIQNPILFETPLGKLSKLSFKMYADDTAITPLWLAYPFDIGINEWDATFQIDEEVAFPDRNLGFSGNIPTIPIPNNPDAFQYLALTTKDNPLNK